MTKTFESNFLTWRDKQACADPSSSKFLVEENANFILYVVSEQNCIEKSNGKSWDALCCTRLSLHLTEAQFQLNFKDTLKLVGGNCEMISIGMANGVCRQSKTGPRV